MFVKMPLDVQFSKNEILQIYLLKARRMKVVYIAKRIGCSRASMYRILSKGDNFETKTLSGRPKKATKRQNRDIVRLVSSQNLSVRSIFREVSIPVAKSTEHRRLQTNK